MIFRKFLLRRQQGRRHPAFHHAAITPAADSPSPHTDTAWGLSMTLVVAKQRCNEAGISSRLIVKTLFWPFDQAGGGRRIISFQPLG